MVYISWKTSFSYSRERERLWRSYYPQPLYFGNNLFSFSISAPFVSQSTTGWWRRAYRAFFRLDLVTHVSFYEQQKYFISHIRVVCKIHRMIKIATRSRHKGKVEERAVCTMFTLYLPKLYTGVYILGITVPFLRVLTCHPHHRFSSLCSIINIFSFFLLLFVPSIDVWFFIGSIPRWTHT